MRCGDCTAQQTNYNTRMVARHLPKAELHCHLDGVIDPPMLREMRRRGYPLLVEPETLQAAYPVRTFEEFIQWFKVGNASEGDVDNYRPVLEVQLERLKAQNVVYAEFMLGTSEIRHVDEGELLDKFRAFRAYINELEAGQIQVEFSVALHRGRSPEFFEKVVERIIRLRQADILFGVALAGWPEATVEPFGPMLARLRAEGMGIEIHAGEWAGPEAVWDALKFGAPHRIGHGVHLFHDPRLVEVFQERQIHIEFCPTSNLKTGSLARLEEHPAAQAKALGLNFSVNTDDPGPFENSLTGECALLADQFGFDAADFQRMFANSLRARFAPELRYWRETKR